MPETGSPAHASQHLRGVHVRSPLDVMFVLTRSAADLTVHGVGVDPWSGFGRLQVDRAVNRTLAVRAIEDTWVDSTLPNQNFGAGDRLRVDGSDPRRIAYVKFDLRGVASHQGAALRVCTRPQAGSAGGGRIHLVAPSTWNESTTTWNTRPALGTDLGPILEPVLGSMPPGTCVTTDITPHVRPKQINAFAIAKVTEASVVTQFALGGRCALVRLLPGRSGIVTPGSGTRFYSWPLPFLPWWTRP